MQPKGAAKRSNNKLSRLVEAFNAITEGLLALEPQNRTEVVEALNKAGVNVVRQTKKSLSMADPEGGRNLRLSGGLYDQAYRGGEALCRERQAATDAYRAGREARIQAAQRCYQTGIGLRRDYLLQRYQPPTLQNRSLEDIQHDSARRCVQLGEPSHSHRRPTDGALGLRPHSRRDTERSKPVVSLLTTREDRQQTNLVPNPGGELDDRIRTSLIVSIEEAGRRADRRTLTHRTAAKLDRPAHTLRQAVDRIRQFGQRAVNNLTASIKRTIRQTEKGKSLGRGISR